MRRATIFAVARAPSAWSASRARRQWTSSPSAAASADSYGQPSSAHSCGRSTPVARERERVRLGDRLRELLVRARATPPLGELPDQPGSPRVEHNVPCRGRLFDSGVVAALEPGGLGPAAATGTSRLSSLGALASSRPCREASHWPGIAASARRRPSTRAPSPSRDRTPPPRSTSRSRVRRLAPTVPARARTPSAWRPDRG